MLKTTGSTRSAADPKEIKGKGNGDSVVSNSVVSGVETFNQANSIKSKNQVETTKSKILVKSKNHDFPPNSRNKEARTGFLTLEAKLAFTKLRQAFVKTPIFHYFDSECHIRIETDASGYAISEILSQLTLDDFGQWHSVAFFSCKMIPAETRHETHDGKLLAIVKVFKTCQHYLEDCKHELLVLTDHNNLRHFMETKILSSRQVYWAQELFHYQFWINYQQDKANGAADALS